MKRLFLGLMTLAVIGISACGNDSSVNKKVEDADARSKDTDTTAVVYTCTMDPEVVSDKPGTCPKCGMDLVKKEK